jgi:isoamylase
VELGRPDWSDGSHSLALTLRSLRTDVLLHGMFNAYWEPLTFRLPPVLAPSGDSRPWRRWIDTSLGPPADVSPWATAPAVSDVYEVQPHSAVVLVSGDRDALIGEG